MTPRESLEDKAVRLLGEGRLTVTHRDGELVQAECRGDSGTYILGHDPRWPGHWPCTCPALGRCSHVVALQLVVIPRNALERKEAA